MSLGPQIKRKGPSFVRVRVRIGRERDSNPETVQWTVSAVHASHEVDRALKWIES